MKDFLLGVDRVNAQELSLTRESGVEWTRLSFVMPFEDRMHGRLTQRYVEARAQAELLHRNGMKILGTTPLPFSARWEPDENGALRMNLTPMLPEWLGPIGSATYNKGYEEICSWLADDLRGIVPVWQIANELDIDLFAGPMTPRQSCEFIVHGAKGLKRADPSLLVGHNPAGDPEAYYLYGWLYGRGEPLLDYCGVDGYYGTWQAGGPESWAKRITELSELTGVPVLLNEWGFSSGGELMPNGAVPPTIYQPLCQERKWWHTWGPGHTPEGQAEFIRECFKVFRAHREKLLGAFYFKWKDAETCWQCGRKDCPIETHWGLLEADGKIKPSLAAYKEGAAMMKAMQTP